MHRPIAGGFRRAQSARHEGVSEAVCVVGETGFEPLLDGCPYTLRKYGAGRSYVVRVRRGPPPKRIQAVPGVGLVAVGSAGVLSATLGFFREEVEPNGRRRVAAGL
jgi:hypothetical protein